MPKKPAHGILKMGRSDPRIHGGSIQLGRSRTTAAFLREVGLQVRGSLPVLLLLCLLTAFIHQCHLLDNLDGWFMRKAVESVVLGQHQAEGSTLELPDWNKRIVVLEASTLMRVTQLEHGGQDLDQSTLDRLGGVRPIDRIKFAEFLNALASRLELMHEKQLQLPTVVAIDVDMTPLQPSTASAESDAMRAALNRLRKHVHVVAIVLDRQTEDERRARNRFMVKEAECSLESPGTDKKGLYYASSRVFYEAYGYPLHFPQARNSGLRGLVSSRSDTPGQEADCTEPGCEYPSVANLIHALAEKKASPATHATLTHLCYQASREPKDGLIPEDRVAGRECLPGYESDCTYPIKDRYRLQRINWKLAGIGPIEPHLLAPESAALTQKGAVTLGRLDLAALSAGTVLVGIDGGSRQDRFDGATVMTGPISGAQLHALQAASRSDPVAENYSLGMLIDFVVGLVFLASWFAAHRLLHSAEEHFPKARSFMELATVMVPAGLAALFAFCYFKFVAPGLLRHADLWSNPAYLLLGLVVHAYIEAAYRKGEHGTDSDFSFGAASAWKRWPPDLGAVVPAAALLICAAGILALVLAGPAGHPAALLAATVIVVDTLRRWRKA
jgi:hypothetical protein